MGYSNTIKSDAGDFAACGRRVSFWMPRKKPKRHQGAAQVVRRGTLYPETFPHFRRGGTLGRPPGGQAKKSPSSVTLRVPPYPFWPSAISPCQGESAFLLAGGRLSGGSWTRPYGGYGSDRVILVGAGLGPARGRTLCAPTTGNGPATRIVPLIRLAYGQPPSPKGEGYGRPQGSPLR